LAPQIKIIDKRVIGVPFGTPLGLNPRPLLGLEVPKWAVPIVITFEVKLTFLFHPNLKPKLKKLKIFILKNKISTNLPFFYPPMTHQLLTHF
jgi:hypothetical protein